MTDRLGHYETSPSDGIARLTSQQLDAFAAECAVSAATVFALHNWTWSTAFGDKDQPYVPGVSS